MRIDYFCISPDLVNRVYMEVLPDIGYASTKSAERPCSDLTEYLPFPKVKKEDGSPRCRMQVFQLEGMASALSWAPTGWSRVYLDDESWIEYIPDAVGCCTELFDSMWRHRPLSSTEILMFGRKVKIPRRQAMYGRSYSYSGITVEKRDAMPALVELSLLHAQLVTRTLPYRYDGVLVNWYKGGAEYIAAHSDDETELSGGPIISYSFGAIRVFRVRRITVGPGKNPIVLNVSLASGSCCIMGGRMQELYQHEVPKMLRVKGNRINMTVRTFSRKAER